MPRTDEAAVRLICELDEDMDLTPFLETASALVTDVCSSTYSPAKLELIERWLAAHFASIRDKRVGSEGAGGVSQGYQVPPLGFNLASTHYGQMAITLDTLGGLAKLSKSLELGGGVTVGVTWLGSD